MHRLALPIPTTAASSSPLHGASLMLLSVALFTANALLIRVIGNSGFGGDAWHATFARCGVGLLVAFATGFIAGGLNFRRLFTDRLLVSRGLIGGVGVYLYYLTIGHLGAGRATFINLTYVLFAMVFAAIFLKERLAPAQILGAVIVFAGLALITGIADSRAAFNRYDALAVLGALLAGIVIICIRKLAGKESASTIFASQCVYGLIISAPPSLAAPLPQGVTIAILLTLSGVFAASGQLLMTRAYRDMTVTEGGILQMLLPVCIGVCGWLFLGERWTFVQSIGAALIITGCLCAIRWKGSA